MMKKVFSLVVAAIMAMSVMLLTACGLDKDAVKGDWKLKSINDKSLTDYAAELGTTEDQVWQNLTVNDDKATTENLTGGEGSYDIEWGKDGFILKTGDVAGDVGYVYDADAKTLTAKYNIGGTEYKYVFEKGKFDLSAAPADDEAAEGEVAEEEAAE